MIWELFAIVLVLLLTVYVLLERRDKKQLIKLKENYNKDEDKSRRTSIPFERRIGKTIGSSSNPEQPPIGISEFERRELLPSTKDKDGGTIDTRDKKSKRSIGSKLFRRRK